MNTVRINKIFYIFTALLLIGTSISFAAPEKKEMKNEKKAVKIEKTAIKNDNTKLLMLQEKKTLVKDIKDNNKKIQDIRKQILEKTKSLYAEAKQFKDGTKKLTIEDVKRLKFKLENIKMTKEVLNNEKGKIKDATEIYKQKNKTLKLENEIEGLKKVKDAQNSRIEKLNTILGKLS